MERNNCLKLVLFLIFISCILITSCSVEKRVHQPGFYISKNHSKSDNIISNSSDNNATKTKQQNQQLSATIDNVLDSETSKSKNQISHNDLKQENKHKKVVVQHISKTKLKSDSSQCDLIIFNNGEEILVKVTLIDESSVRYHKCNNLSGPLYSIEKSDIFMIRYANGTKDVFGNKAITSPNNVSVDPVGIISLAASVVSIFFMGIPFGVFMSIPLGVLAVITGIISMNRIFGGNGEYQGGIFGILGIIIGIISVIAAIYILIG